MVSPLVKPPYSWGSPAWHPTLRFELEAPDAAGFLPILDVKIKINVDGSMERKLYTKPASKGIT